MIFSGSSPLCSRTKDVIFTTENLPYGGRDDFIRALANNKWIFDHELKQFFIDPFYEHDINFLKSVRIIDLREKKGLSDLVKQFEVAAKKMSVRDLDWRITLRAVRSGHEKRGAHPEDHRSASVAAGFADLFSGTLLLSERAGSQCQQGEL